MELPLAQPHSATPPEMVGIFFAHEKVMSSLDYYYHQNYWDYYWHNWYKILFEYYHAGQGLLILLREKLDYYG